MGFFQRDAFVEQLFHHSDLGRLHDQDAIFNLQQQQRVKDPEALLTLPEFIREPLPVVSSEMRKTKKKKNGDATTATMLFSLVKEPSFEMFKDDDDDKPAQARKCSSRGEGGGSTTTKQHRKRSRSLSAPPLAWFRSSASKVVNGHHNHNHEHRDDSSKGKSKANDSQGE